jgi:hypothetical protein
VANAIGRRGSLRGNGAFCGSESHMFRHGQLFRASILPQVRSCNRSWGMNDRWSAPEPFQAGWYKLANHGT